MTEALRKTLGGPEPVYDEFDVAHCPKCGADLTDEFIPGYGLAYGGFGTYWYCVADDCDWFFKILDEDEQ